jgi:hypothetical protein
MATEATANKAIIVLRNITHPPSLVAFKRLTLSASGRKSRTSSEPSLGHFAHFSATECPDQQPRQMLFSLRSIVLFSSAIVASVLVCGPAAPVVTPGAVLTPEPEDCAVPALLVPGDGGEASLLEFPAPLGSLPELFSPPTLAGPDGTPLTPAVPAPAEPAFGEPAALPVPAEGPLAAPPVLPPLAPPALCANETVGDVSIAIAANMAVKDVLFISNLLFAANHRAKPLFPPGTNSIDDHWTSGRRNAGDDDACAN